MDLSLRPPHQVMRLSRLGAFHQTRLSFVRSLMRTMMAEQWQIDRVVWEIDDDGYGTAVYHVAATDAEPYSVVFFSDYLAAENRTDRVIAEQWDVAFALCVGHVTDAQIAELHHNLPLQEAGRYLPYVLVISRANKSTRNFDYVLDCLVAGRQPDVDALIRVGYLYRTTAVYGNGKFGIADYAKCQQTQTFAATFRAQMFAVWMLRHFVLEQIDFVAHRRNRHAARLDGAIARYLGVGNATGLGMAPFLVTHPSLLHQWVSTRERALALVLAHGEWDEAVQRRCTALLHRARQHVQETATVHPLQAAKNDTLLHELDRLKDRSFTNADALLKQAAALTLETQSLIVSVLLELYPELVNRLADEMAADETVAFDPQMSVGELRTLIETHYAWMLGIEFAKRENEQWFWYRSAEKEEPRLGDRWQEAGAEKEQPLDIARQVATLYRQLGDWDAQTPLIDFLLAQPQQRGIVRRVQATTALPYGEIQDNLIGRDCLPIDLLRCKLSFFGASKFDPRSNLWVRITLFQGAPLAEDIGQPFDDDWFWPTAPVVLDHNATQRPLAEKTSSVRRQFVPPQAQTVCVSHNEIVMLCRKYFEALGWAEGDWLDHADMFAWCEQHDLPMLHFLKRDHTHLQRADRTSLAWSADTIDAQGASVLQFGYLLLDKLYQRVTDEGMVTATVINCRHQPLLLGYMRRVAQRGVTVRASWQHGLAQGGALFSAETASLAFSQVDDVARDDTLSVAMSVQAPPESERRLAATSVWDAAMLAQRAAAHRDHGYRVSRPIWQFATEVGKGILVAASDASRQRGAGEAGGT